jgi:hypothetical protein
MCQKKRGFGPWRAIVDLAGAMSEMLDKSEASAYSENELKTSIKNRNWVMYRGNDGDSGTKRRTFGLREVKAGEENASLGLEWGVEYG